MFSLLSHASGLIGGRADERICIGRLTVDRVFIALPVMAYSVGLERPFPTGYGPRLYTNVQDFFLRDYYVEPFSRVLLESLSEIAHIIFPQSRSVNV